MKKIVLLAVAALAGVLLAGCAKVSPTEVNYKYNATVRGSVEYANGNAASGFEVSLSVSGAPQSKYHAVTGSDGNFSISIPCLGKDGLTVAASISNFVYKGKKYNSKSTKTGKAEAGGSTEKLVLELNDGVSVE